MKPNVPRVSRRTSVSDPCRFVKRSFTFRSSAENLGQHDRSDVRLLSAVHALRLGHPAAKLPALRVSDCCGEPQLCLPWNGNVRESFLTASSVREQLCLTLLSQITTPRQDRSPCFETLCFKSPGSCPVAIPSLPLQRQP